MSKEEKLAARRKGSGEKVSAETDEHGIGGLVLDADLKCSLLAVADVLMVDNGDDGVGGFLFGCTDQGRLVLPVFVSARVVDQEVGHTADSNLRQLFRGHAADSHERYYRFGEFPQEHDGAG